MLVGNITEQCLAQFLSQFQNLLNAGVITVKKRTPAISLTQTFDTNCIELRLCTNVELGFRGEEEIQRLKQENERLSQRLRQIEQAIKELPNG